MTKFFFLALLIIGSSFAQISKDTIADFIPTIASEFTQATVGYGNQGVIITHEGENTFEDILLNFESIDLEDTNASEWTVEWINEEGEVFNLINEDGSIVAVGPNLDEVVSDEIANALDVPESSIPDLIGTLAQDLVEKVDNAGGELSLTGQQAYDEATVPVASAIIDAKFSDAGNSISSGIGNVVSSITNGINLRGSNQNLN